MSETRKVFLWGFIIASSMTSLALIVVASSTAWGISFLQVANPRFFVASQKSQDQSLETLKIDRADQRCVSDSDCSIILTACSSCECGGVVHKDFVAKYSENLYGSLCKNQRPWLCEISCTKNVQCRNNLCTLIDIEILENSQAWQTYQNNEYGFEVKYSEVWSEPVFQKGEFFSGGAFSPEGESAFWQLYIGEQSTSDCYETANGYPYYFEEYPATQNDKLIDILLSRDYTRSLTTPYKDEVLNGNRVIWYDEGGEGSECEGTNAMIFGNNRLIRFSTTAGRGQDVLNTFNQIVSTFQFVQPQGDIPSDWQTYRNEKYGITLQYPKNWDVASEESEITTEGHLYSLISRNPNMTEDPYFSDQGDGVISLYLFPNISQNLDNWYADNRSFTEEDIDEAIEFMDREVRQGFFSRSDVSTDFIQMSIGGFPAVAEYRKSLKPFYIEGGAKTEKIYYVKVGNNIYEIYVSTPTGDQADMMIKLFDTIISSIQFISQDTSNWQIYQSEEGFIVRHPQGWKVENNYIYTSSGNPPNFFSLYIQSDFSSLDEYLETKDAKLGEAYHCVMDFSESSKNERKFIEYTDRCYYEPTKIFAVMYQQKVIEAIARYMPSNGESQIILEILSSFKFKE